MTQLPTDFSVKDYLDLNPDVAAAGVDPVDHYLRHGAHEGRRYRHPLPPPPLAPQLRPLLDDTYERDGLTSVHNHDFMMNPAFQAAYSRGMQATGADYRWQWRVHIGLWAAQSAARVPGDFVECGVNRGFLSSAIMEYLNWDQTGRMFYLLDTFAGLDPQRLSDEERAGGVLARNSDEIKSGFYTTNIEQVQANFSQWRNVRMIAGSVPDTLPLISATQIAFLHIDMNCVLPEVAALDRLWPRLAPSAIVLLDDYAYRGYQPQKAGMDAWATEHGVPIASLPTGQGLLIKT